jgi:hypothetical protein
MVLSFHLVKIKSMEVLMNQFYIYFLQSIIFLNIGLNISLNIRKRTDKCSRSSLIHSFFLFFLLSIFYMIQSYKLIMPTNTILLNLNTIASLLVMVFSFLFSFLEFSKLKMFPYSQIIEFIKKINKRIKNFIIAIKYKYGK